jgi:hypothetical protein
LAFQALVRAQATYNPLLSARTIPISGRNYY